VVGLDITTGLPRIEELFEARTPKNQAVLSEINGIAEVTETDDGQTIKLRAAKHSVTSVNYPRAGRLR